MCLMIILDLSVYREAKFEIDLNPEILRKNCLFLRKMKIKDSQMFGQQTLWVLGQFDVAEHDETN